jgi:hypothetical protein
MVFSVNVPHRLYQGILYLQNSIWYHATHINVNLFLCIRKSIAIPSPIFMKIINGQQHHIQISYTILHPNQTISMDRINRSMFIPLYDLCTDFHAILSHLTSFFKHFLNKILLKLGKMCESVKYN